MVEDREQSAGGRQDMGNISSPANREQPVSPDRVLSAVANEQRRAILDSLHSASENSLGYDALVDHVVDRVGDEDVEQVSDEHRQRVRTALRHIHLPQLEEAGMIDYEADTGHVQFVGGELAQELLAVVKSHDTDE